MIACWYAGTCEVCSAYTYVVSVYVYMVYMNEHVNIYVQQVPPNSDRL